MKSQLILNFYQYIELIKDNPVSGRLFSQSYEYYSLKGNHERSKQALQFSFFLLIISSLALK